MRFREQTLLKDSPENRKRLEAFLNQIELEIKQGHFDYAKYFPESKNIEKLAEAENREPAIPNSLSDSEDTGTDADPLFHVFAEEWFLENEITWKISHRETVRGILDGHLNPRFGVKRVSRITKGDILKFRSSLAKVQIGKRVGLSASRINHIIMPLRMILNDAADRFNFNTPFVGIKPLKVPRTEVDPFNIDEVNLILANVRKDFKNYYTVRFFTAMRTGEIDGLQWKYVDFERRQILIRETIVKGRLEKPKTAGSAREIHMSSQVYNALKNQKEVTYHKSDFVFCNNEGNPLEHGNITKRIWYPMLKLLGLKRRKPYQTRHTMATLWLAAGENPEWIARQMGHTSTEMLFTVYSRFVPNLTRRDGSAIERMFENMGESADAPASEEGGAECRTV
jgi:integrase